MAPTAHDTQALRKIALNQAYQQWLTDRALESANNGDQRVEILAARGLLTTRRLAGATDSKQMEYATDLLKAEMKLLTKTEPDTDEVRQAKESFLSTFDEYVARISPGQPLESQRMVWQQSLEQHAGNVRRWEAGIKHLFPETDWWSRIAYDSALLTLPVPSTPFTGADPVASTKADAPIPFKPASQPQDAPSALPSDALALPEAVLSPIALSISRDRPSLAAEAQGVVPPARSEGAVRDVEGIGRMAEDSAALVPSSAIKPHTRAPSSSEPADEAMNVRQMSFPSTYLAPEEDYTPSKSLKRKSTDSPPAPGMRAPRPTRQKRAEEGGSKAFVRAFKASVTHPADLPRQSDGEDVGSSPDTRKHWHDSRGEPSFAKAVLKRLDELASRRAQYRRGMAIALNRRLGKEDAARFLQLFDDIPSWKSELSLCARIPATTEAPSSQHEPYIPTVSCAKARHPSSQSARPVNPPKAASFRTPARGAGPSLSSLSSSSYASVRGSLDGVSGNEGAPLEVIMEVDEREDARDGEMTSSHAAST